MYRKFSILLSIIILIGLLLAPAGSVAAKTVEPVSHESAAEKGFLPAAAPNLIQDPSLEASYGSLLYWTGQASSNADSPLCKTTDVDCLFGTGAAAPRTGTRWAMFGGIDWQDPESINPEVASLSQNVTFPSCGASLQFYFWIGRAPAGSGADDLFDVWIDNTKIFSRNATHASSFPAYTLVTLDVSNFADAAVHRVKFHSITSDQSVVFNLDDISLTRTCVTISGNAGIAGATLDYTGGSTTANGSGNYSFNVPFDWSGTVTPSKTYYSFSPENKVYTNLTTDQTAQDYTATFTGHTISGNVGVAGVTLSYTDGTSKTATSDSNGDYSFIVTDNWSGTVTPSHPCYTFNPPDQSYANVTTDQPGQDYELTPIPAAGCAEIKVDMAAANEGTFPISTQGRLIQNSFPSLNKGPVKIYSTVPILGAERVIYKVSGVPISFSEMIGLPAGHLDKLYWLPWYNNKNLYTQLRIANISDTDANVQVTIGGVNMGSFSVASGAVVFKGYVGINKGPVKIESDVNIVASERVIYKVNRRATSFSEMMALPANQVDHTYWLPWYDSKNMDTQLRIGNVSGMEARVRVWIGSTEVTGSPFTIPADTTIRRIFMGINKGPVKIESNQDIVAAERVSYTVNGVPTSYSEMMALPAKQLDTIYWLPSYNNIGLSSQLRITNVETTDATVHVFIGGVEVSGSPFIVPAKKSILKAFLNTNGGLVKIESESGIQIVVSERVIYKVKGVKTSFSEIIGLPAGQLSDTYWLPWYNNVQMDTALRFGVP